MVDVVDFKLFPPALPREVPRVDPQTGLPSDQLLDWESYQANAIGQATANLNQSVITLGDDQASFQSQIDVLSDDVTSAVSQVTTLTATVDGVTAEGRVAYSVEADGSGGTDVVLAQTVKRTAAGTTYKGGEYLIIDSLGSVTKLFDVDNFYVGRFSGGTLADFVKLFDIDAGTGAVTVNRLVVTTSLLAPDAVFTTGRKTTAGITPSPATGSPVTLGSGYDQAITMPFDGTIEINTQMPFIISNGYSFYMYIRINGTNYLVNGAFASYGDLAFNGHNVWSIDLPAGSYTISIYYTLSAGGTCVISAGEYRWKIFYKGAA